MYSCEKFVSTRWHWVEWVHFNSLCSGKFYLQRCHL